jgi:ABC-2 type transport system permease protein
VVGRSPCGAEPNSRGTRTRLPASRLVPSHGRSPMTSTAPEHPIRVSTSRVGIWTRIAEIWRYRELLVALTRTQLKVKYKNSALGFLWSMLNPALYLVVFYVVFQLILGSGIPNFPIFLLSGLLVWNLHSYAIAGATGSIVGGAGIIKKVSFPREILPLASVGAGLVHFFLQGIVLVLALVVFRYSIGWEYVPLLIPALLALLLLGAGIGLWLSAINVKLRDTMHMVELAMLAWFWMTPIVYPFMLIESRGGLLPVLYRLNPVVWIVITFQRAIYNRTTAVKVTNGVPTVTKILPADAGFGYYAWHLAVVGAFSLVLFVLGLWYFGRVEGNFSEDL